MQVSLVHRRCMSQANFTLGPALRHCSFLPLRTSFSQVLNTAWACQLILIHPQKIYRSLKDSLWALLHMWDLTLEFRSCQFAQAQADNEQCKDSFWAFQPRHLLSQMLAIRLRSWQGSLVSIRMRNLDTCVTCQRCLGLDSSRSSKGCSHLPLHCMICSSMFRLLTFAQRLS